MNTPLFFTSLFLLICTLLNLRWRYIQIQLLKRNDNSLDLSYPIKIKSPNGYDWYCVGLGKEGALVSKYKSGSNKQIVSIDDFHKQWTLPKHLGRMVDKIIIERNSSKLLIEAIEELNQTVGS